MSARVWIPATRAVITGAGSGIGRATALALAAKGAVVACVDIDEVAAKATAAECGQGATAHQADVRDREQLAGLGIDDAGIVMANAGVGVGGRFTDMTQDDWEWIRSINLDGVVNTVAVWGPSLLEQGRGHFVITSSGLGFTPSTALPAYCATKAAVLSLAASLRADWAEHGVGVTAVCPGVINTPIIEAARFVGDDEAGAQAEARKIFGKGHSPKKVAKAVVRAIETDRGITFPGFESKLAYGIHRFAPFALQQKLAAKGVA